MLAKPGTSLTCGPFGTSSFEQPNHLAAMPLPCTVPPPTAATRPAPAESTRCCPTDTARPTGASTLRPQLSGSVPVRKKRPARIAPAVKKPPPSKQRKMGNLAAQVTCFSLSRGAVLKHPSASASAAEAHRAGEILACAAVARAALANCPSRMMSTVMSKEEVELDYITPPTDSRPPPVIKKAASSAAAMPSPAADQVLRHAAGRRQAAADQVLRQAAAVAAAMTAAVPQAKRRGEWLDMVLADSELPGSKRPPHEAATAAAAQMWEHFPQPQAVAHAAGAFTQGQHRVAYEAPDKRRRVVAGQMALPRAPATDRRMAVAALVSACRPSAGALDRCVGDWRRGSDTHELQACREAVVAAIEMVEIKKGGENEVDTDGPPSETTEEQEEDEDDCL